MTLTASEVFRDYTTDAVPSSGNHDPKKSEIRALLGGYENIIAAFTSNGGLIYSSRTTLNADLAHAANSMAWVVGDSDVANNGIYRKIGASGTGSWTRVADLPFSFIVATDAGAGTPNAIQATSSIPVTGSALVWMSISQANTSSPVTVSFNGGPALTVKTNSGNDVVAGGLIAGMIIMGIVSGSTFRLISDQASAAIVAAAEAAAAEAADYAEFAKNNWVVSGPFVGTGAEADYLLAVDPGSTNNMFVDVDGLIQITSDGAYALVYIADLPYIRINVPTGIKFEVRTGNAIDVGTIADGSVGTSKIAPKAVTLGKIQDIATLHLLGRVSVGAGSAEELTAAQLRDAFLPAGSVIDSVTATYTANTAITASIPTDNTVPQSNEGIEILAAVITPKSTANRLRIRISGIFSTNPFGALVWAIFLNPVSAPNAIMAGAATPQGVNAMCDVAAESEISPGSTATQVITVRVGPSSGATLYMNGQSTGKLFGGVEAVRLTVEEIKG